MSWARCIVRGLLIGSAVGLCVGAARAQCLSAADVRARIDHAMRQPRGPTAQFYADIRQQLIRNRCPADTVLARVTMRLGYAQYFQPPNDSALVWLRESIRLYQRLPVGQRAGLVQAFMYLGQVLHYQDDVESAAEAYQSSVTLGGNEPRHDSPVGYALSGLALLAYQKGDYEAGLVYAEQSIQRARRCRDFRLEARSLNEAARCLLYLDRYETALRHCERAVSLTQNDPSTTDERRLYELFRAQALAGLRQYDRALSLYKRLLTDYQRTKQYSRVADVCDYIGELYATRLNDQACAIRYYQQAYTLYDNPYEKSRSLDGIGRAQQQQGQYRAALITFQRALQTLPIQFHKPDLRANPEPATIRLSAHKEYLLTLIWHKADTWLAYAQTTSQPTPALTQALSTYRVADQMIDQMRWAQHGEQSKLYWRQQTRAFYERALETCYRLNNPEQALHFFEKSRAVLLTDKLNELGASRGLPPALQAEEQALRRAVDGQVAALSQLQPGSAAYTTARAALMSEQDRADAFTQKLERINSAYYRYRYDNWVPALTDLYQYLGQRQAAFVSYFVGDRALYVLNVQEGKAQINRHPLGRYQQTVREYLALLGKPETLNRSFSAFHALSKQLYSQLLAPLHLSPGRVIVSPDGPFIPFETLRESPDSPTYALDQFAFSYAYSARFLLRTMQSPGTDGTTSDFLGVAPVRFSPGLNQAPLPGSEAALRTIGDRFATPTLLLDKQATRRAFLDASASFRVVHLFTHALADSSGQEPRLFFADSTVSLSELGQGTLMNTQLVTLAACETGTGVEQRGEGVFSLARGFAALGVPAVLTTLWSVQNKSTYQITAQFYRYLADGLPKDIALQRARQDWLRTAEGTDQLPSAWAGLILVGNTEPLSAGGRRDWLGGLSGLLVGGLCQLGWRRWRRERTANTRLLSE
ncbi:CHAT domain-containing protein [Spirosoma rhododendri]|uniref:CHAT domain-containing protein n=1 Tax=Spirosoma rhododendri TaxID=2728024 RepID=A0A7L5DTM5_9BACT|nr:CHAT domain-containing protein [Spirosoma rhododendri]QJD79327.1 CHAT domain-containing protein [Spirosoma rhododendri]